MYPPQIHDPAYYQNWGVQHSSVFDRLAPPPYDRLGMPQSGSWMQDQQLCQNYRHQVPTNLVGGMGAATAIQVCGTPAASKFTKFAAKAGPAIT